MLYFKRKGVVSVVSGLLSETRMRVLFISVFTLVFLTGIAC